jgi:hypothetical protein
MQMTIFDTEADIRRDDGIRRAVNHANYEVEGWADMAYEFLQRFLLFNPLPFMAEDVRRYAEQHGVPIPPSKRAWGGVVVRASKAGIIKSCGYGMTSNPKAHRTPAMRWTRA